MNKIHANSGHSSKMGLRSSINDEVRIHTWCGVQIYCWFDPAAKKNAKEKACKRFAKIVHFFGLFQQNR